MIASYMMRLLQFGTFLFLLVTFLAPLTKCFDHWDVPGISNDTEFAVFAFIFALCLVLVVYVLISARSFLVDLVLERVVQQPSDEWLPVGAKLLVSIFVPPRLLSLGNLIMRLTGRALWCVCATHRWVSKRGPSPPFRRHQMSASTTLCNFVLSRATEIRSSSRESINILRGTILRRPTRVHELADRTIDLFGVQAARIHP
jgi:hypothetical protein